MSEAKLSDGSSRISLTVEKRHLLCVLEDYKSEKSDVFMKKMKYFKIFKKN